VSDLPISITPPVPILAYHWVDPDPGRTLRRWGLTPQAFEAQMTTLAEGGYQVLTLGEALEATQGLRLAPRRSVVLTFDDGYRGLLEHAVPVLERFGFSATFFLVSDRVGGSNTWDARHGDPPRPLLDWREAAMLLGLGMEVGSHSRTHPFLTRLPESQLQDEILGSKRTIEDRLGVPVRFFCYPHGLHDDRCLRLVEGAGYAGACSTLAGANGPGSDPFRLHRTEISFHDTAWSFSFKVRTGFGLRDWAASKVEGLRRRLVPRAREVAS
jgi:peptidoglycan/xylan/chitin deacetylase (PgdA/CDA1 family)